MDETKKDKLKENTEDIVVEIKDYYREKEIYNFMKGIIDVHIKRILLDLNNYIENGDWKNCILLINKLTIHKIFKYATEEYKIKFLDILIKKLLHNIYIYSEDDLDGVFDIIYYTLKYVTNYKIDWKFFYTLFNVTHSFKSFVGIKSKLFISLHKYYSEDEITLDEYKIMRRTFLDDILMSRQTNAFCNFIYFFPKKYILEDDEIQLRLLYLMQNRKISFINCCVMFHKILRKNGKFCFSKDEQKNKEYIDTFIRYYFTLLDLLISGDGKVVKTNYESPIPLFNKEYIKKVRFEKSVVCVLIELLFNPNLKDVYSFVELHFTLLLNNKHLYLKEKSKDAVTKNYIAFLQSFIYGINRLFHDKVYNKEIGKFILIPKKFDENEFLFNRLLIILKYLSLNLEKLFLFDNEGSCFSQRTLFLFLNEVKFNNDFMKKIIENINIEVYIKMLGFFKEYSETRMAKYVMKLYTIMPLLFNEYIFTNYPKVRELLKDSIQFLADNVSSANASVDIDILIIFCYEFFRIKDLSQKNKIYESLIPVIEKATEKIMNNILIILDLVAKKNYYDFQIFILSLKKFLGQEKYKKISSLYANFIENNEIESSNLDYYFLIITDEEHINLFNHMYNNLLYVDDSNNIEINKNFIYPKIDKDFNIDISKCSIEIFIEKQLQRYQRIFLFFDYTKILSNDKMVKKFYEIYFALMNQKDKKFKKFGSEFFGFVINSILECKVNEKNVLIEYPSEYHLNVAIQMYEKIIIPYENVITDYMKKHPRSLKDSKNKEIEKEKETKNKISEKLALEELLENYMRLMHKVNIGKCNILLNLNFEQVNLDAYKYIQKQIKIYKKYKALLKNSLKVINQIYEYNGGTTGNYLFSNHNTNLYFDEILAINIKEKSQKINSRRTLYENINNIIFNNNLNNFREIYLINKARIFNINNFETIKLIMPKEESYYTCMKLYLLCFNSVNHPSVIVSSSLSEIYSNDREKIKKIFNDIYDRFITALEKLKNDSLVEQNIMKNISNSFFEFCKFVISLFTYDSIDIIEKIFKIIMLLKTKKFLKIDTYTYSIITNMKSLLQEDHNKEMDKRYCKEYKKDNIIEGEMNKIFNLLQENNNRNIYVIKHQKNTEQFIEMFLTILYQTEKTETDKDKKDIKYKNLNHPEIFLFYNLITSYAISSLDKKSELYKKLIKFAFNNMIIHKSPVSARILWLKRLCTLISKEYKSYLDYEWIIFESDEEYLKFWNQVKYEVDGKYYIPYPCERIRKEKFIFNENINKNKDYNLNLEEFLISMAEIDEYEEDQKLVKNDNKKKLNSLDEVISKLVTKRMNEKKGLDFNKAKMFYYMFNLKYIDYNLDFVKNLNFTTEFTKNEGKKIKQNCVIYEFILGKYQYMFDNNLFTENDRNDLWAIMDRFTRRVDKIADERIYAFFNYLFNNYALKDLEFIFQYDFYKYPVDFVGDMYFLYHQDLPNLRNDTKMFINSKTEELLTKIFSTSENIILDLNYLVYILKIYYTTNGILNYNYNIFTSEFTDKLYDHFMGIAEKCDTNYRRYALSTIYNFFFDYLNNNLELLKATIPKMGLCINEFNISGKTTMSDKSKKILTSLELSFRSFTGNIHFPSLCDAIVDILNKENDRNDTNKLLYLQVVNLIYKGQKHLNIFKYSSQEIFDSLFKVFSIIKNEELKKNFSSIFLAYFNDLTEEENIKFIEKYEKYIFESVNEKNEDKNKYNYIYILMNQLLRFKIRMPKYMQEFIIKLKSVNKSENDKLKKIIIDSLKRAMNYYHGSYIYMKENISEECKEVLEEMTREKAYFV